MTSAMRPRAYSPAARATMPADPSRVLVIACGALARELVAVIDQAGLANVDLTCLPATLHNRPGGIPAAVRAKIRAARPRYRQVFIAYADCGTGGLLDRVLADEGVERLPGAHCYEVYSGVAAFGAMTDEDPATFFLTDFLARNFDRLVWVGLGLDRHPELLPSYFGNYRRLIHLAQTEDPGLVRAARRAARRLGLAFELRRTGYGDLATSVVRAVAVMSRAPGALLRAQSVAPDATLASGARDADGSPRSGLKSARSLHPGQLSGADVGRSDESVHPTQEPRTGRTPEHRYVLPLQQLHALQRSPLNAEGHRLARTTSHGPTHSTSHGPARSTSHGQTRSTSHGAA